MGSIISERGTVTTILSITTRYTIHTLRTALNRLHLVIYYTALHCTTLHYTTLPLPLPLPLPLHYTTLHYTILHYTTLHYTTLRYATLHKNTRTQENKKTR